MTSLKQAIPVQHTLNFSVSSVEQSIKNMATLNDLYTSLVNFDWPTSFR